MSKPLAREQRQIEGEISELRAKLEQKDAPPNPLAKYRTMDRRTFRRLPLAELSAVAEQDKSLYNQLWGHTHKKARKHR